MENASKALLIAGGMLFAMMILALLVSVVISINDAAESQDRNKLSEQIQEFNKGYEVYNKTKMFGTDVITVVNKAIDHNKTIRATEVEPYYINIKIKVNQTFKTEVMEIKQNGEEREETILSGKDITIAIKELLGNPKNNYNSYLELGTYELGTWQKNGEEFIMYNNFVEFFSGDVIDKTVTSEDKQTTYVMYSALTNFKTSIFKCTNVDYNEGRISSMTFEQI